MRKETSTHGQETCEESQKSRQKKKITKTRTKGTARPPIRKRLSVPKAPAVPAPIKGASPAPADPLPWRRALAGEALVGAVDDYYGHLSVIALTLKAPLKVGEKIHVRGHTTDMSETVTSIQIDHRDVVEAQPGDAVGIKAVGKCRCGDFVYKVL